MSKRLENLTIFVVAIILAGCGSRTADQSSIPRGTGSPLFIAIEGGKLAAVKEAISGNPELLRQTEGKLASTPLHKAVAEKQLDIVRFLIESGAGVNAVDGLGRTALVVAADAEAGPEITKLLKDNGAED